VSLHIFKKKLTMKNLFIIVALFCALSMYAQQDTTKLQPVQIGIKLLGGHYPIVNGKKVPTSFARDYMSSNQEAYILARRAKVRRDFGVLFGIIGVGNAINNYSRYVGGDFNQMNLIPTLSFLALGYASTVSYRINLKKATDVFNAGLQGPVSGRYQQTIDVAFVPMGIQLRF
jgi:hypothetical protein